MFPAAKPTPPTREAPITAFPMPNPFLFADKEVEPHFGQQAIAWALFSAMRCLMIFFLLGLGGQEVFQLGVRLSFGWEEVFQLGVRLSFG